MKIYTDFHGEIQISEIGKQLREIVKKEKNGFKLLTGYGSVSGKSKSKIAVLKSLSKMKEEGLIKGFLPGEVKNQLLQSNSPYLDTKLKYASTLKQDNDFGNDGIVFVFVA